jgi:hypothetical protein
LIDRRYERIVALEVSIAIPNHIARAGRPDRLTGPDRVA